MSDHDIPWILINASLNKKGSGFWRLNVSTISEDEYKVGMKQIINECKAEKLETIPKWEWLKYNIKRFSLKYAKSKNKRRNDMLRLLDKKLRQYQEELLKLHANRESRCEIFSEDNIKEQIRKIEQDREEIIAYKVRGAKIRAKRDYHWYGERNSKYFFNMESKEYKRKNRYAIRKVSGKLIKGNKEIITEQDRFYKKLYTEDLQSQPEQFSAFTKELKSPKLSETEQSELEKCFTLTELRKAIIRSKRGKVCGSDGIPIEFYQEYFEDIKHLMLKVCQDIAVNGLFTTAKQGIIALIEKTGKPIEFLTHWRPLSLLNCDGKVYAKMLAHRLDDVAQKLIHEDQAGFLKNRLIHKNLLDLASVIDLAELEQTPGIIVSFDFEKAFDKINWEYIDKVL